MKIYLRTAKANLSLRVYAVWSGPLLCVSLCRKDCAVSLAEMNLYWWQYASKTPFSHGLGQFRIVVCLYKLRISLPETLKL